MRDCNRITSAGEQSLWASSFMLAKCQISACLSSKCSQEPSKPFVWIQEGKLSGKFWQASLQEYIYTAKKHRPTAAGLSWQQTYTPFTPQLLQWAQNDKTFLIGWDGKLRDASPMQPHEMVFSSSEGLLRACCPLRSLDRSIASYLKPTGKFTGSPPCDM